MLSVHSVVGHSLSPIVTTCFLTPLLATPLFSVHGLEWPILSQPMSSSGTSKTRPPESNQHLVATLLKLMFQWAPLVRWVLDVNPLIALCSACVIYYTMWSINVIPTSHEWKYKYMGLWVTCAYPHVIYHLSHHKWQHTAHSSRVSGALRAHQSSELSPLWEQPTLQSFACSGPPESLEPAATLLLGHTLSTN